jgi:hypothetical protein
MRGQHPGNFPHLIWKSRKSRNISNELVLALPKHLAVRQNLHTTGYLLGGV